MAFSPTERCVTFVLKVPKFAVWLVALLLQPKLANLSKQGQEERDKVSEDATVSFFKAAGSWRNGQSSPLLHPDLWERIDSNPSSEVTLYELHQFFFDVYVGKAFEFPAPLDKYLPPFSFHLEYI